MTTLDELIGYLTRLHEEHGDAEVEVVISNSPFGVYRGIDLHVSATTGAYPAGTTQPPWHVEICAHRRTLA